MTTDNGTAPGTAVEQVAPGALALVDSGKPWTLDMLAGILAGPIPDTAPEAPLPAVAPQVTFTDQLKKALKQLPLVFGKVMPTERRELEAAELTRITEENIVLAAIAAEIGKRQKAIDETIRHHQDAVALRKGLVADDARIADGIAKGHLLIAGPGEPFNTPVDGYEDPWQQRRVKGSATMNGNGIYGLYEAGEVTRAEYLAWTKSVRTFDDLGAQSFIRKHPQRGLEIVRKLTKIGRPGASLYSPKK